MRRGRLPAALVEAFEVYRATLARAQRKPRTEREVNAFIDASLRWCTLRRLVPRLAAELEGSAVGGE